MAVFTTYYHVDMTEINQPNDDGTTDYKITIQTANHLQMVSLDIVDNFIVNFYGNFTYDSNNKISSGILTGLDGYAYGSKIFSISAMNLDVHNINNYTVFFQNFSMSNDTVNGSSQNDRLDGFAGNDILYGNAGNDHLIGDIGNDSLVGGAGKDTLVGGSGADSFIFKSTGETGLISSSADIITDFNSVNLDKINVSAIDANMTTTTINDVFKFIGTAGFSSSNATAQLRFDTVTHTLYGSVDADSSAEFAIQVSGVSNLTATSLIL
jgi:Ca2+-binding RTX toxin-like protein